MPLLSPLLTRLPRFWRDRSGLPAIEFALLAPVLILLVLGSIEAANLYSLRNEMVAASRDAARRIAVGSVDLESAELLVAERIRRRTKASIEVQAYEVELADDAGFDVVVEVAVPLAEAMITGLGGFGSSYEPPPEETTDPHGSGHDTDQAEPVEGSAQSRLTIRVSTTMLKES